MKQKVKNGLISIVLVIAIATIMVAGCTDTASVKQGQATSPTPSGGQPTVSTAVLQTQKTAQPTVTQVSSATVIKFDPIKDKKAGDKFTITGTTSLSANTNLFWQIIPDPGTPPTGVDLNAPTGIMATTYVLKGIGASNKVSLDVDTKDLKAGKYVVIVASLKGDPMTTDPSTGTLAGYTYLTLS